MDQTKFLSKTLWQFSEVSAFTDLVLVCKDGEVSVHSPMLTSVFSKFGFNLEKPGCLVMPDHRYFFLIHDMPSHFFCISLTVQHIWKR